MVVSYRSAAPGHREIPADGTRVFIDGPDAEEIYTPSGSKDLRLVNGTLTLAIKKTATVSAAQPLEFTLRAELPGFIERTQTLRIGSAAELQTVRVMAAPADYLPESVSTGNATVTADATTGTTAAQTLDVEAATPAAFTLPAGTQLQDAAGNAVSGEATLNIAFYDAGNAATRDYFPTSLDAATLRDAAGEQVTDAALQVLGYYEAHLTVGNTEVKTLSEPMLVSMALRPDTYNQAAQRVVEPGDEIPVYSLDETTGEWQYETVATVEVVDGELAATYAQSHFSVWALMLRVANSLQTTTTFTVSSGIAAEANSPALHWALFYESGLPVFPAFINYQPYRFHDGQTIEIPVGAGLFPFLSRPMRLEVYSSEPGCGAPQVISSNSFSPTAPSVALNLGALTHDAPEISVEVSGLCSNAGTADFRILPSGTMFYRLTGCDYYEVLGFVRNGRFETEALQRGATYDFGAEYDGTWYEYKEVPIESTTKDFFGTEIKIDADTDRIRIEYLDVPVPEKYCDLFGG